MERFKLLLLFLLTTSMQLFAQAEWKAYKIGNYVYFENKIDGQFIEGGVSTIEFRKKLVSDTSYRVFKDGVDQLNDTIYVGNIEDINGLMFTSTTFEAWKVINTGISQDVYIQDQATSVLDNFLGIELNTTTLTIDAIVDDPIINVTVGHGIVAGNYIEMYEGLYFSQTEVKSVSVNAITLYMPIDQPFTTSADINIINVNLNVNGSVTEKIASFNPKGLNEYHIVRAMLVMTHTTAGDDGLFGDLTELTNGVYFRAVNSTFKNLFNAKNNGDLRVRAFDLTYSDRAGGGGTFSTSARRTFGGQDKNGVVVNIDGNTNEKVQAIIRDNLTGLITFRILIQGHVVNR